MYQLLALFKSIGKVKKVGFNCMICTDYNKLW